MSVTSLSAQRAFRLTMAVIVGGLVAWCAWSFRSDLKQLSFTAIWYSRDLVLLATILSLMNYTLRTLRWRWYMHHLGHRLPIEFSALTYVAGFAFTLSPAKVGELIRARYYRGRNIPLNNVVAAMVVERLMDLLAMSALAILVVHALPQWERAVWIVASVVAAGAVLLVAFPLTQGRGLGRMIQCRVVGQGTLETLMSARALLTPRAITVGLLFGVAAWGFEGLGLAVLSSMVPAVAVQQLDALVAVGIYAVAVLIGALSFLPGGLGGTETIMAALLVSRGYAVADAALITLTCRMVTLWFAVCLGWLAVGCLRVWTGPK